MIIEPKMRGFICLTAHPAGCAENVKRQISYVESQKLPNGPKKVLVIGASTGFGLSSRITAAFGAGAATIGVFFEKEPLEGKTASAGYYNTVAFHEEASHAGLYAKSINGDAFSKEVKQETIDLIKQDLGTVDLVIYSLASPVRKHPETGVLHRSVLKPIDQSYQNKTVDFHTGIVTDVSIEPATGDDIPNTIAVMGGEDWQLWLEALRGAGVLAPNVITVAYSYIGPELTNPVYRHGTIGRAKDHLEATAARITEQLKDLNGSAFVSVNKALVTQSSSAIPVVPLYISLLYKVMKEKNIHEGTIEQMSRLFHDHLYAAQPAAKDAQGRIRIDDWELREDVQAAVAELWKGVSTETISQIGDLKGYKDDFLNLFGFSVPGIDYTKEVDEMAIIK
ncbi:enoyl-ACP reductase FabV [Chitinophaga sancti]|uniref:Enoyl-[acyl-carrier-protein] reductase [NADH] n=1 Tax=Chitinophaga sancti TaxID=1004 RepID=A0A1K1MW08_9BACT|nr:enoyl-ACP reductase FabV [Chitinophaga sancti]WQD63040.1 enoyl-ACP reductase FabV [Chitinophaga sancti]WQG91335.1 enoyl-ACP reductase FabV [Chitinophaga sancti]SFW27344.1 enoyl-[acyl-carrier protein] reductase / trans-2-enoyl-CoA reductase (NAD+) [Chitinophaga sancti]